MSKLVNGLNTFKTRKILIVAPSGSGKTYSFTHQTSNTVIDMDAFVEKQGDTYVYAEGTTAYLQLFDKILCVGHLFKEEFKNVFDLIVILEEEDIRYSDEMKISGIIRNYKKEFELHYIDRKERRDDPKLRSVDDYIKEFGQGIYLPFCYDKRLPLTMEFISRQMRYNWKHYVQYDYKIIKVNSDAYDTHCISYMTDNLINGYDVFTSFGLFKAESRAYLNDKMKEEIFFGSSLINVNPLFSKNCHAIFNHDLLNKNKIICDLDFIRRLKEYENFHSYMKNAQLLSMRREALSHSLIAPQNGLLEKSLEIDEFLKDLNSRYDYFLSSISN